MTLLKDHLLSPDVRPSLIKDCCVLIDQHVKSTKGFAGIAVKSAYTTVKAIKSRFVEGVVDALLDEWMGKLEDFEKLFVQNGYPGGTFDVFLIAERVHVAEALVSVTDARAATTKHRTAAKLYHRLRASALAHVDSAIPDLGRLVLQYGGDIVPRAQTGAASASV